MRCPKCKNEVSSEPVDKGFKVKCCIETVVWPTEELSRLEWDRLVDKYVLRNPEKRHESAHKVHAHGS